MRSQIRVLPSPPFPLAPPPLQPELAAARGTVHGNPIHFPTPVERDQRRAAQATRLTAGDQVGRQRFALHVGHESREFQRRPALCVKNRNYSARAIYTHAHLVDIPRRLSSAAVRAPSSSAEVHRIVPASWSSAERQCRGDAPAKPAPTAHGPRKPEMVPPLAARVVADSHNGAEAVARRRLGEQPDLAPAVPHLKSKTFQASGGH